MRTDTISKEKEHTMTDKDLAIQLKELNTLVSSLISTVNALQRRVKNLEDGQVEEVPKFIIADSPHAIINVGKTIAKLMTVIKEK